MKRLKTYRIHLLFIILSLTCILFIQVNGDAVMKTTLTGLDAAFHFSRIESLADIFQSPINFDYFNHIGSMANLFYPWLTVYPMYLFYAVTGNIVISFYLYFIILTFIGLELTYFCAKKMNIQSLPAVMTAVIYMYSLCRISNIYYRVAIGEAVAMTFLPLVLYGCYALFYTKQPKWWPLAIGMTLVTYTHVISLILATTLIICFMGIALVTKKWTKAMVVALSKATGMTILLSSAFLLPMMEVMISQKITSPHIYQLFDSALTPQDFILQSLNNDAGAVNSYGIVLIILLCIVMVKLSKMAPFFKHLTWLSLLFTVMATKLFPWMLLQPILLFIQFPWRFVALASLLISMLFGYYLSSLTKTKWSPKHALLWISVIILLHLSVIQKITLIDGKETGYDNNDVQTLIRGTDGFNGDRDYIPQKGQGVFDAVKAQNIAFNHTWCRPDEVSYHQSKATYQLITEQNGYGALPVYYYKGLTLTHNGKTIPCRADENGLVYIPVKKGNNTYTIHSHYTSLARIAQIMSMVTAMSVIGYNIWRKIKEKL